MGAWKIADAVPFMNGIQANDACKHGLVRFFDKRGDRCDGVNLQLTQGDMRGLRRAVDKGGWVVPVAMRRVDGHDSGVAKANVENSVLHVDMGKRGNGVGGRERGGPKMQGGVELWWVRELVLVLVLVMVVLQFSVAQDLEEELDQGDYEENEP